MAVHGDHACVAADVGEGLVVRTWHDVAAVAAHQPELGARDIGEEGLIIRQWFNRTAARRGFN